MAHHCIQPNEGPRQIAEQWTGSAERWRDLIDYNHYAISEGPMGDCAIIGWEPGVVIKIPPYWEQLRASFEKTAERDTGKCGFCGSTEPHDTCPGGGVF